MEDQFFENLYTSHHKRKRLLIDIGPHEIGPHSDKYPYEIGPHMK
jgi:hypothetical protein